MAPRKSLFVMCALALLACAFATEMTLEMKQQNMLLVQMETEYVVDDVLVLLKSFQTDIETQVSDITENLRIESEYVTNVINTLEQDKVINDI